MNTFESRLFAALGQSPAEKIYLAAVSGGADSSAMLAGLAELREEAGFTLHCIHVEHGIRPAGESRGDARAVEALSEKLEVPCRVVSIPPGKIAAFARGGGPGIEGAARYFRHKAWNREARRIGADRILTAHTRDDLLETLLMRILRGAGPAGLAPMPRSRGRILRPLLDLTRRNVLDYLEEKKIPYRTDSTNADIRYLRNRVRLRLIPFLDSFFPSWRSSLLALAETQSLAAEFLAAEVRRRLSWEVPENGKLRLSEEDFLKAPPILREEAVFAGADILASNASKHPGGKRRKIPAVPRRAAVRRAARQGAAQADDLGPVRLERRNGFITMTPAPQAHFERGFSLLIKEAGFYTLKGRVLGRGRDMCIRVGISSDKKEEESRPPDAVLFSAKFPLVLRNHRGTDCICPKGTGVPPGHKRRFSDILDRNARSEYTGIITAEDADGPAALIGMSLKGDLIVIRREESRPSESSGGTEVSRSFLFEISLKTGLPEICLAGKPITGGLNV